MFKDFDGMQFKPSPTQLRLHANTFNFFVKTANDTEQCTRWCVDNLGPRRINWNYRGAGVFSFRCQEDAVLFQLTWG
jgi:hypothetical protein